MWHKSQEIDYDRELTNDQDYQEWSEQLRRESENQQAKEVDDESEQTS